MEDAGDTLHAQRNTLDSGVLDPGGTPSSRPGAVRFLAEGRDPSATIDAANGGFGKNEGDNEITGIHVSDGDSTVARPARTRNPRSCPGEDGGRLALFWTQQHGDNVTWEVRLERR